MNPVDRLSSALADRYRIERELGQGGMATVYLAQDLKHDRKVAIKVLRPELAAVIGAERFLREIKTTANLQHPHILGLIDSGQTGGQTDGRTDGKVFVVSPDDQSFLMLQRSRAFGAEANRLTVVLNWFQELDARMRQAP